ncbi:MAG: hypothetical protein AB1625_04915 [Acidobacteriota bacterium]
MFASRVTIVVGHFGSGKTEIAVNGAIRRAAGAERVALVDLDVVKPCFRSRSTREQMAEHGVRVVAPQGELAHADLPVVLPDVRRLFGETGLAVILDVGGDPVGTRALGSVSDAVPVAETEVLLVLNFRRPYTESVDDAAAMVREIGHAARLPVNGLVSNTHLLDETTPDLVREGYSLAADTGRRLGIPVVAVCCDERVRPALRDGEFSCPLFALRRLIHPPFEQPRLTMKVGPLFALN